MILFHCYILYWKFLSHHIVSIYSQALFYLTALSLSTQRPSEQYSHGPNLHDDISGIKTPDATSLLHLVPRFQHHIWLMSPCFLYSSIGMTKNFDLKILLFPTHTPKCTYSYIFLEGQWGEGSTDLTQNWLGEDAMELVVVVHVGNVVLVFLISIRYFGRKYY